MGSPDALTDLSERLRRLEDLDEIRRLYIDYGLYLDAGDAAAYSELFARDAKLRLGPVMRADGREEILQAATKVIGSGSEGSKRSVHVLSTPRIDLDGDTARGECVWAAVGENPEGPSKVLVGRHVDRLVREDGHWRFAERRGYVDVGALRAKS